MIRRPWLFIEPRPCHDRTVLSALPDSALGRSPDPDAARLAGESIAKAWTASGRSTEGWRTVLDRFPLGTDALVHLLAVSPISAEKLSVDPGLLEWLAHPEISASDRGPMRMRAELAALRGANTGFDSRFVALRQLHRRELLRIALREVAGASSLAATTRELSALAEVILQEALTGWQADCARRWGGAPATGFAILGLGKLGGRDLNFSSDVDLMFLYGEDGTYRPNFSNHEYFARLGEKLTSGFAQRDPAGSVFRLDLRLRPEGKDGPLVVSLASAENYYAGHGETWERLMLAKARRVAGDEEVTYDFAQRLQPFVYPRSIAPDTLAEIGELKARIERENHCADLAAPGGNVKLGPGGIREIEFIVGALQLIHGARQAFLQDPSTPRVLASLARLEFLPDDECAALASAYGFLRTVEHRLQIEREAQTHSLPLDAPSLDRLARSLRLADAEALFGRLRGHAELVRRVFHRLIESAPPARTAVCPFPLFRDATAAQKNLARLAEGPSGVHAAPRTRRLFSRLEPMLIEGLARGADPDAALLRFLRFVEAYGIRGLLLEMLITHPRLLDLLLRVFDAGDFFASLLIRRPGWLEEVVEEIGLDGAFDAPTHLKAWREHDADFETLRRRQKSSLLRVAMRDLLGLCGGDPFAEITAVAEASVQRSVEILGVGDRITIVAFGKLGGRELGYGADLDVILLGDDTAAGEKLTRSVAQSVAEGGLFPLDTRLRPEGVNGPIVSTLGNYAHYFTSGRAQPWEAQALTKSRPVSGPLAEEFSALARRLWETSRGRGEIGRNVAAMLQRVHRERAGDDAQGGQFKTGPGGLVAIEFLAQALQWEGGIWEPTTRPALAALRTAGALTDEEHATLDGGYAWLRQVELVLRREDNKAVSCLPAAEADRARLARRLGEPDAAGLTRKIGKVRAAVRAVVERHLPPA